MMTRTANRGVYRVGVDVTTWRAERRWRRYVTNQYQMNGAGSVVDDTRGYGCGQRCRNTPPGESQNALSPKRSSCNETSQYEPGPAPQRRMR